MAQQKKTIIVQSVLDENLKKQLNKQAEDAGMTSSAYIRKLIKDNLKKND